MGHHRFPERQCVARLARVAAVRIAGPPTVRRDRTIRRWTNLARDMFAVWEAYHRPCLLLQHHSPRRLHNGRRRHGVRGRDGEQVPHAPCRKLEPCAIWHLHSADPHRESSIDTIPFHNGLSRHNRRRGAGGAGPVAWTNSQRARSWRGPSVDVGTSPMVCDIAHGRLHRAPCCSLAPGTPGSEQLA